MFKMCVSSESVVSGVFNVSVFLSLTLSGQNGSSARLSFFKLHQRSDSNERYSASSQRWRTAQISFDSWIRTDSLYRVRLWNLEEDKHRDDRPTAVAFEWSHHGDTLDFRATPLFPPLRQRLALWLVERAVFQIHLERWLDGEPTVWRHEGIIDVALLGSVNAAGAAQSLAPNDTSWPYSRFPSAPSSAAGCDWVTVTSPDVKSNPVMSVRAWHF